jgi:hypothetical protein
MRDEPPRSALHPLRRHPPSERRPDVSRLVAADAAGIMIARMSHTRADDLRRQTAPPFAASLGGVRLVSWLSTDAKLRSCRRTSCSPRRCLTALFWCGYDSAQTDMCESARTGSLATRRSRTIQIPREDHLHLKLVRCVSETDASAELHLQPSDIVDDREQLVRLILDRPEIADPPEVRVIFELYAPRRLRLNLKVRSVNEMKARPRPFDTSSSGASVES